mmetsp:Transcript_83501/g.186391  ORF Transcript_83501/g.186391 Transcript_83501/m.186391 type:complete len:268 (-) Transcript_83501:108-911(-)
MASIVAFLMSIALCYGQPASGGAVALVQSAVHLHRPSAEHAERGDYLVDNSGLQHDGPGVVFRLSKNLSDIAGGDMYAAWGTVLLGAEPQDDGWVEYQKYYLPTHVQGVRVLTAQEGYSEPPVQRPKSTTAHLTLSEKMLKTSQVLQLKAAPDDDKQARAASKPAQDLQQKDYVNSTKRVAYKDVIGRQTVKFHVEAGLGSLLTMSSRRDGKWRTIMLQACDRYNIPPGKCGRKVDFLYKKAKLNPDDNLMKPWVKDGDTILMHVLQ